ncbi:MAG: hypothetical protein H7Z37_14235 [Pyrinomonadaceae bacterium]|nr:hypothetical protein [Pyrinomonadaceae bacterium]
MVKSIGNGNNNAQAIAEQARRVAAEQAKRQAAAEQRQREIAAQAQRELAANSNQLNNGNQLNQTNSLQAISERTGLDANISTEFQLAKFTRNQSNGEGLPTAENFHSLLSSGKPAQKIETTSLFGQARELFSSLRAGVDENTFAGKAFKTLDDFAGKTKLLFASAQLSGSSQPVSQDVPLTFTGSGAEFDYGKRASIEPNASPEEVAQFILRTEQVGMSHNRDAGTQIFLQSLENHKGDNQWNQEFFKQLGPEKTAELISQSLTTGVHQYSSPEKVDATVAMLRDTISGLASANPPLFTQADMNTLVEKMVKAPGDFHDLIALELFGKMGHEHENVKNMFFDAASGLALNGNLSDDEKSQLATAATHVLANTSANNQAVKLNEIRESGEGKLTQLIGLAMKGTTETPSLQKRLGTLMHYPGERGPADPEPYGRVDGLLFNAAYSGYGDAYGPPVSSDDLKATRMELFTAASNNLANDNVRENYEDSTLLKDGLSQIFMEDFDSIIKDSRGTNGASFKPEFQTAFTEFFEFSMFTEKPGNLQKSLMSFTADKFKEMGQALQDESAGAEQSYQEKFGISRSDGANVLGLMLGTMTNALETRNGEIKENAESRDAAIGLVFDLTVGLIPGVGEKLSDGAEGVAADIFRSVTGTVQDAIVEQIKDGSLESARDAFIKANSNGEPDKLLFGLFEGFDQTLPDELPTRDQNGNVTGNEDYLAKFRSAYGRVINSPERASEAN